MERKYIQGIAQKVRPGGKVAEETKRNMARMMAENQTAGNAEGCVIQ